MTQIIQFIDVLGVQTSQTATKTTINASTSSIQLLPANNKRSSFIVRNTSNKTMYISFVSPSTSNDISILTNAFVEIKDVKTALFGIWSAAPNNGCVVTELTYDL